MSTTQFTTLDVTLTKEDYQRAKMYTDIQKLCLNFLAQHYTLQDSMNFINTKIDHDYYIWCIAVIAFEKCLPKNIQTKTWEKSFNIKRIIDIINRHSSIQRDIDYIHAYVCKENHIKIKNGTEEKVYDIRTALTKLEPKPNWNFLFAINKIDMRKNDIILLYCIGNKNYIHKIVFPGIILYTTIKQCPILRKGQTTKFGTINKIDNHVTTLNKHYIH